MREGKESGRGLDLWVGAGLFVGTVLVFAPALRLGFIELFDDGEYVARNPIIGQGLTLAGLWYAVTTPVVSNWHPVTMVSHMLDAELYGQAAWGHHLTNVLLHALAATLVFVTLRSLTASVWASAFVAALFAVHPMHVESVAWIAERKDVLSACFWFLATLAYVRYVRGPSVRRYAAMAALYAVGLMAKPMLVTLPMTLLLLDHWPLNRVGGTFFSKEYLCKIGRLVREKAPLFVMSAASSVVTFMVQRASGAVMPRTLVPIELRMKNVPLSYVKYIAKLIWPSGLAALYPLPVEPPPLWRVLGALGVLGIVTVIVLRQRRRRSYLWVGWFWYLGTLVPVIGIIQVGGQAWADRYSYIPSIGLFAMVAWVAGEAIGHRGAGRQAGALLAAAVLISFSAVTWRQLGYWQNTETLFRRALAVTEGNWCAHHNLGVELRDQRRFDEAEEQFREALRLNIRPEERQMSLLAMGRLFYRKGDYLKAAECFIEADRIVPGFGMGHMEAGLALEKAGRREEAMDELREAAVDFEALLVRRPRDLTLLLNAAFVCERLGKKEDALRWYEVVLRMQPHMPFAREAAARLRSSCGG